MNYQKILPWEALRGLVSHYWVATWDRELTAPKSTYYTVANTLTDITFAFADPKPNSGLLFSAVQGHTERANQIEVPGFYHLIGASLFSNAIPTLFEVPAGELSREFISLNDLLGVEAEHLTEQIEEAANTTDQINLLNRFFLSRLKSRHEEDNPMAYATQLIKINQGQNRIPELASACCLSQKQFERRFKCFTGFNPKVFSRIVRFESVVKSGKSWNSQTEAAHELGYHDQAHFIREFKSFTGLSPREFWKLSED
ncbi:helix-turn-helix domain-containing protein [Algoriphagus sp.]|uniref:helix-turn-helix domain-containing protein n=1 Tax=Algoriphagus sp. TaxID=1872435 RepID=UPI00261DA15C|nr:helix-turn-helix domain-containing protein [Algoriphagus sp.]